LVSIYYRTLRIARKQYIDLFKTKLEGFKKCGGGRIASMDIKMQERVETGGIAPVFAGGVIPGICKIPGIKPTGKKNALIR